MSTEERPATLAIDMSDIDEFFEQFFPTTSGIENSLAGPYEPITPAPTFSDLLMEPSTPDLTFSDLLMPFVPADHENIRPSNTDGQYLEPVTPEFQELRNEIDAGPINIATARPSNNGTANREASRREVKNEKYWQMRKKNNRATKRCREMAKSKEENLISTTATLEKDVADLTEQNQLLQKKCKRLNNQNKIVRDALHKIASLCKSDPPHAPDSTD